MALSFIDKVCYQLGYYDADANKKEVIQGFIEEAEEFMKEAGVPNEKLNLQRANAIKSLWADARDKGEAETLIKKESMIVHLIAQLRR